MTDTATRYRDLLQRAAVLSDLQQVSTLLFWDQETHLPRGAAEARGQQKATVGTLAHELLTDPGLGELVEALEAAGLPEGSVEAAAVRQMRRAVDRASKLPVSLVEALEKHTARARAVWERAREDRDFRAFAPELERTVALKREEAEALGYEDHPYDALHDLFEPGSTTARLRAVFTPLRRETAELVRAIGASGRTVDDRVLHQPFDEGAQRRLALDTVRALGYDLDHGRLDASVHPFTEAMSKYDVRITTRYDAQGFAMALFGAMHEAGHALYEQGIEDAYYRTPLEDTAGLGIHESQSRLWENLVGRSRDYWEGAYPKVQRVFPQQLGSVPLETFYAAINKVEPSFVRVDADEVTYNLHVMLRFELEQALITGDLSVADLPVAWNDFMHDALGITPPNDALGVLQDVHWSAGHFGYFPTYTLGNLMSVQLFEAALAAHPEIPREIREGCFGTLLGWLRENVHCHGARYLPDELLKRATGSELDAGPYLAYLRRKYGEIYELT